MCEIEDCLKRTHDYLHLCAKNFDRAGWEKVDELARPILDVLNESDATNGIKLMAVFHVLMIGSDHLNDSQGKSIFCNCTGAIQ